MYKTTKEENEILTRVGSDTPMGEGELLRRYWWPVGISGHLKDKPTFIRLLGEDLVLFRDSQGRPRILGALCSHRRANLCLGVVEKDGLRCRYHGWLYDGDGKVLQTPGEPEGSKLKDDISHTSYPAEELGGLVFAYLGPKPVPLLPRFHFLAAEGEREVIIQGFGRCNWLQAMENGIDPFHTSFLHADIWEAVSAEPERTWFDPTDWGLAYKTIRPGRKPGEYNYREHHMFVPSVSSGGDSAVSEGDDDLKIDELPTTGARWSVPIDDENMMHVRVRYRPPGASKIRGVRSRLAPTRTAPYELQPYKEYQESGNPTLGYEIPSSIGGEDAVMLDSLGRIADRENENLSVIDGGIIMLRQFYLEQIEAVKAGRDPKGVIRDPEKNKLIVIGGDYRWIDEDEREEILAAIVA